MTFAIGRYMRKFVFSAGIVLFLTGAAKLVSVNYGGRLLNEREPIFGMTVFSILIGVGIVEVAVGVICMCKANASIQLPLLAWLATEIALYRAGMILVDYKAPCTCLGTLTEVFNIPHHVADRALISILIYLFIGSYAYLFITQYERYKGDKVNTSYRDRGLTSNA